MIKSFSMIKRKSDLSQDEFLQYWREKHAPLAVNIVPGLRQYVQCHPVKVRGPGVQFAVDGISQIWWDNLETLQNYLSWRQSEKGKVLKEDEEIFIDTSQLARFYGKEHIVVEANIQGGAVIKSFSMIKRKSDLSQDEFLQYWREKHAPLVVNIVPGLRQYVQCHPVKVRGPGVQFAVDGISQIWWDNLETLQNYLSWRQSEKGKVLKEDEEIFIDTSQLARFYGKEHIIVER